MAHRNCIGFGSQRVLSESVFFWNHVFRFFGGRAERQRGVKV